MAEVDALGRAFRATRRAPWVRPLHSIVATFGPETEEPDIVTFAIDGIAAGNITRGHRFLAPQAISGEALRRLRGQAARCQGRARSASAARTSSCTDAKHLAFAQGFELVEDPGLLDEVAGLVEWPVVLMGSFDKSFSQSRRR